jgi:hypothetical protein
MRRLVLGSVTKTKHPEQTQQAFAVATNTIQSNSNNNLSH